MLFDERSRQELPKPQFEDVRHATVKGLLAIVPGFGGPASELMGLLSSPLAQRRDDWFADLARRLRDLEGRVEGFRFENLDQNEQFISATQQATLAAMRTHQAEKLDALKNAVLNIAVGREREDRQTNFIALVDRFTPAHLKVLQKFMRLRFTGATLNGECGKRAHNLPIPRFGLKSLFLVWQMKIWIFFACLLVIFTMQASPR